MEKRILLLLLLSVVLTNSNAQNTLDSVKNKLTGNVEMYEVNWFKNLIKYLNQ